MIVLKSPIIHDEYTKYVCNHFDYPIKDTVETIIENNIKTPIEWNIGIIYGPSGSGKSTLLKNFGKIPPPIYNNKAIISQFCKLTPKEVIELFTSVGLNNVHTWLKPYNVLSVGEKARLDLAYYIYNSGSLILIDEFTSTVNRDCAESISIALEKYIKRTNKKIIISTCHEDIIKNLNPNWVYDTFQRKMIDPTVFLQQRKPAKITIRRCSKSLWKYFCDYHYLTDKQSNSSRCYITILDNKIVGYFSLISFPHGSFKNGWRIHRLVILPDYQGRNIGRFVLDLMGGVIKAKEGRLYIRTSHIGFAKSFMKNHNWESVGSSNYIFRLNSSLDKAKKHGDSWVIKDKVGWSFKYSGPPINDPNILKIWE